jgi:Bacteriophage HK97-gp10, putative tail-component
MGVKLEWDGLKELKQVLRSLPDDLAKEAGRYVQFHAQAAAGAVRRGYPRVTGNLQDGVVVEQTDGGRYGAKAIVKSKAPHAYIYEFGTEARHYYTSTGTKKSVGRMPAGHVFIPRVQEQRRRLMDDLSEMVIRAGLMVRRAA